MPSIFVNPSIVVDCQVQSNVTTELKELTVPLTNDDLLELNAVHGSNKNPRLYKTRLCKNWENNGKCAYEDECQFAHGFEDLKSQHNINCMINRGYTQ